MKVKKVVIEALEPMRGYTCYGDDTWMGPVTYSVDLSTKEYTGVAKEGIGYVLVDPEKWNSKLEEIARRVNIAIQVLE